MPELPEVETVRSAMARHLTGRRIISVDTSGKPLREPLQEDRLLKLAGRRFVGARRRAKYLILVLDDGAPLGTSLADHLGDTLLDIEVTPNRPDEVLDCEQLISSALFRFYPLTLWDHALSALFQFRCHCVLHSKLVTAAKSRGSTIPSMR